MSEAEQFRRALDQHIEEIRRSRAAVRVIAAADAEMVYRLGDPVNNADTLRSSRAAAQILAETEGKAALLTLVGLGVEHLMSHAPGALDGDVALLAQRYSDGGGE